MTGRDRINERLVALFLLGLLLFLPPLLLVFNRPDRVIGIPALYLYIFVAWAGLIALSALISARIGREAEAPADTAEGADKPLEETSRA